MLNTAPDTGESSALSDSRDSRDSRPKILEPTRRASLEGCLVANHANEEFVARLFPLGTSSRERSCSVGRQTPAKMRNTCVSSQYTPTPTMMSGIPKRIQ